MEPRRIQTTAPSVARSEIRGALVSGQAVKVGDRIELLSMVDDPCPIPAGATGTVDAVFPQPAQPHAGRGPWCQYSVKWDAPHERRTLMVISPPDQFKVLK